MRTRYVTSLVRREITRDPENNILDTKIIQEVILDRNDSEEGSLMFLNAVKGLVIGE